MNTAFYLDTQFKDSFDALEHDVKQELLDQIRDDADDGGGDHVLRTAEASNERQAF